MSTGGEMRFIGGGGDEIPDIPLVCAAVGSSSSKNIITRIGRRGKVLSVLRRRNFFLVQ